jgi:tRNA(Ile)-lysidine synthase
MQEFLKAGDRVAVAVSGGADSVALLHMLLELREKLGILISIAHFNHQLRGRASDADEKFVAQLAVKYSLELHVARADVAAKAKRDKSNLEETARRARYAFFEGLISAGLATKIAVAHTADDQAETVLAHILRGTGLAGLGGIHPVAGHVVRPLLTVRRSDLRAYLRARKQPWREDATNRDTTKTRARIRKKLMPLLEKNFKLRSWSIWPIWRIWRATTRRCSTVSRALVPRTSSPKDRITRVSASMICFPGQASKGTIELSASACCVM